MPARLTSSTEGSVTCPETVERLDRVEALLLQVVALLTDEGAEDEQDEQRFVVTTMDGKRHEVADSPSLSMSRDRGEYQKSGRP